MSFTDEQREELKSLLAEQVKSITSSMSETFGDNLEKTRRELRKEFSSNFEKLTDETLPEVLKTRFDTLNPYIDFIKEVQNELESEKNEKPDAPDQTPATNNISPPQITEFQQKLKDAEENFARERESMRQRLESFEKQAQEAEQRRVEAEDARQKQEQRDTALSAIRSNGSVRPGTEKQLLLLLESEGLLDVADGALKVKSKDKFGDPIHQDLSEALPGFLEGDFAHFVTGRQGAGTAITPQNTQSTPTVDLSGLTADEMYAKAKAGGSDWNAMLGEIEQQMQG